MKVETKYPCEQCDEACYYHCTRGGTQEPECVMTEKEKCIREAYGEYLDECQPDENGWTKDTNRNRFHSLQFDPKKDLMRPLALQGIETNNGWIKIESEADLPKETIVCWFIADGEYFSGHYNSDFKRFNIINVLFYTDEVTHYQKSQRPEKPLY